MTGTNLKANHILPATGVAGSTDPIQVYPYDNMTVTFGYVSGGGGAPQMVIEGSNDPTAYTTPGTAAWTTLITIAALTHGAAMSGDTMNRRFLWYRWVWSGGHADDVSEIQIYLSRPR
jgi:hypothetical protein